VTRTPTPDLLATAVAQLGTAIAESRWTPTPTRVAHRLFAPAWAPNP